MRHLYFIFLLITISCNRIEKPDRSEILDELSIGLVEAWSETQSAHWIPELNFAPGDTFTIYSKFRLIKHTEDSLISLDCEECYITLPANSLMRVTEVKEFVVNLETVNTKGTKIEGFHFKNNLQNEVHPTLTMRGRNFLIFLTSNEMSLKKE